MSDPVSTHASLTPIVLAYLDAVTNPVAHVGTPPAALQRVPAGVLEAELRSRNIPAKRLAEVLQHHGLVLESIAESSKALRPGETRTARRPPARGAPPNAQQVAEKLQATQAPHGESPGLVQRALTGLFGTQQTRDVERLAPTIASIEALDPSMSALTDVQLKAKTAELKAALEAGATVDDILVSSFAVVREAAWRVLRMKPYTSQVMGGLVLHQSGVAEMQTGEGKTLAATMPVYLNALLGHGVHVVTSNDYLAARDADEMGALYRFLGLSVGSVIEDTAVADRKGAYAADITYGTATQFGFDYLRDNMVHDASDVVQREPFFAIVDEADSILIDEAKTPLIISDRADEQVSRIERAATLVRELVRGEEGEDVQGKYISGDFLVDEKALSVTLTEHGVERVQELLGIDNLYAEQNMGWLHCVDRALHAQHLYRRDETVVGSGKRALPAAGRYLVRDGKVEIVDPNTGRVMDDRRWSDGIHQALEAKEGLEIHSENLALAQTTLQNYFRRYERLAGMTGTAATDAAELLTTYDLNVVQVPTNKPLQRDQQSDLIFATATEKWQAILADVEVRHARGQPLLIGTVSVETSEMLSHMLSKSGIENRVLNAKNHAEEAAIIAQAGRKGSVTIATNMAGRGTDIKLGGDSKALIRAQLGEDPPARVAALLERQHAREKNEVLQLGGLHVIGTERHESRRIDDQLLGRAGRQGDPGSSRFYVSLEDALIRGFAHREAEAIASGNHSPKGTSLPGKKAARLVTAAQRNVHAKHATARKTLMEYDDVVAQQRHAIYDLRAAFLSGENNDTYRQWVVTEQVLSLVDRHQQQSIGQKQPQWDWPGLTRAVQETFAVALDIDALQGVSEARAVTDTICKQLQEAYATISTAYGPGAPDRQAQIMRVTLDEMWRYQLGDLSVLKDSVQWRTYIQKEPLAEFKADAFSLYGKFLGQMHRQIVMNTFRMAQGYAQSSGLWTSERVVESISSPVTNRAESPSAPTVDALLGTIVGDPAQPLRRQITAELIGPMLREHPELVRDARVLLAAAGVEKDLPGSEGLVTPVQALRALEALVDIDDEQRDFVLGVLDHAENEAQHAVLLKGLAARSSSDSLRQDMLELAILVRGRSPQWLMAHTTTHDLEDRAGLRQGFEDSCGILVEMLATAEFDPLLAIRLSLDPEGTNHAQAQSIRMQAAGLVREGASQVPRHASVLKRLTSRVRGRRGTTLDDYIRDVYLPLGIRLQPRDLEEIGSDMWRHNLDSLQTLLHRGLDVPLNSAAPGDKLPHFEVLIDVLQFGDERVWRVYDPWEGESRWVPDACLTGAAAFDTAGRSVRAVWVPS